MYNYLTVKSIILLEKIEHLKLKIKKGIIRNKKWFKNKFQ